MNQDQVLSLLRTVLQIIGTSVVAHGTLGINGAMWEQITGALLVLAPTIWSMYAHTRAAAIASVAANPDVKSVVVATGASDGTLAAAQDPTASKVILATPTISAAIAAGTTKP